MLKKVTQVLILLIVSSNVIASEYMSADNIKILFTNKSYDAHKVVKDKYFEMSNKPLEVSNSNRGGLYIYNPEKDRDHTGTWWLEENKYCINRPMWRATCSLIKSAGDGVYHGVSEGKHTYTYSDFADDWKDF